jgi:hypothetical protein
LKYELFPAKAYGFHKRSFHPRYSRRRRIRLLIPGVPGVNSGFFKLRVGHFESKVSERASTTTGFGNVTSASRSTHPREVGRGHREGAMRSHLPGRPGLLRTLWLSPPTGSTAMTGCSGSRARPSRPRRLARALSFGVTLVQIHGLLLAAAAVDAYVQKLHEHSEGHGEVDVALGDVLVEALQHQHEPH